jgi:hypothetical protein
MESSHIAYTAFRSPAEEKLLAIQMQSLRKEDATWALAKLLTSLGHSPRCDATPEQFLGSWSDLNCKVFGIGSKSLQPNAHNEIQRKCARLREALVPCYAFASFIIIYHHLSSFIIICCHVCCVLTRLAQEAATAVAAVAPERFQRCLRGLFPLPKRFELEQLEDDSDPWLRMLQSVDAVVKKGFRQHNDQLRRLHSRDC